jgi:DNA-binding NarL/FixJ family response regulator
VNQTAGDILWHAGVRPGTLFEMGSDTNETRNVGVVHASPLMRDGMVGQLIRQPGVNVVGTFPDGRSAADAGLPDDVILLYDHGTSQRDGAAVMDDLRARLPRAKVLIFGVSDTDQAILDCVRAGTAGCVLYDASADDLLKAIGAVAHGTPPVSPRVVTTLFSYVASLEHGDFTPPPTALTPREEQILQLVAEGMSNKEIAQTLYLQPQTVKNYVHQVLQKLNLNNRLKLIRHLKSRRQ